ncbi:MAG: HDOD domain-containing protein [Actinobacteria bacterium]|nr:HDOD domain-containing protein [Actinomycetota bacterium]
MSRELAENIRRAIDEMPRFSLVADRAMVGLREQALSGESLKDLGMYDARFARQILQMTKYAAFGFGPGTISQGPAALEDKDVLRGVMLAFSLQDFISGELKSYGQIAGELWEHSINCGLSAWMIATKTNFSDLEQAFVAGMMHDIGKIVLDKFLCEERLMLVDTITEDGLTPAEAEKALLGIDHAEAGALLAEKWHFDDAVVEAVRWHHEPEKASDGSDLTVFVHLADCMCMSLGPALRNDGLVTLLAGNIPSLD